MNMFSKLEFESSKVLLIPEVVRVYWEMMPPTKWMHESDQISIDEDGDELIESCRCLKCGCTWTYSSHTGFSTHEINCPIPDPITDCVEKVAFFMKRKCVEISIAEWSMALNEVLKGRLTHMAEPEDWINAGVIMWDLCRNMK